MSKSKDRTRIEHSSAELRVIEDALSYYKYVIDDECEATEDPHDLMDAVNRRRALKRSLSKIERARQRVGID